MATNLVAKKVYTKKQFIPEWPELQRHVPFRVAASACASGLVAHEPALEHSKAPTTDAMGALRTSEFEELV